MIVNNNKLHNCNLECACKNGRYELRLKNENNDLMGYVVFRFDDEERCVWLQKIQTIKKFQNHIGVGNVLICAMEHFAVGNGYFKVAGTFVPSNKHALQFYLKNGYYVPNQKHGWELYDEDWQLDKALDADDVEAKYRTLVLGEEAENAEEKL